MKILASCLAELAAIEGILVLLTSPTSSPIVLVIVSEKQVTVRGGDVDVLVGKKARA